MDETLARQQSLGLKLPAAVAVVGCGGVGSWTAYLLAMAGVPELWLFDHDTVSEHNRNRLPVPPQAVGQLKTEAVRDLICNVRPDCRVYAMGGFSAELADQLDLSDTTITWIVATTDTLASRQMVMNWAKQAGITYMEAAAEGEYGSITGESADWSTEAEADPGYASVPVWAGSAVSAAVMACYHIVHDRSPFDHTYRLGWESDDDGRQSLDFRHHDPDAEDDEPLIEPPIAHCRSCGADVTGNMHYDAAGTIVCGRCLLMLESADQELQAEAQLQQEQEDF